MGRKLFGLTVGFLLTVVLAFYLFPPSFDAIIRWLAPYLGPWLRFGFMFLFLIFGNPIAYPTVLIIWVVVGIVAGLFCRSIGGGIVVAVVIFILTFLTMIIGFVAMIIPLVLGGGMAGFDILGFLGAIPPDVSLFQIIDAPVIGPIIDTLLAGMGGITGGGITPEVDIMTLLQQALINAFIIPAIINFILLTVFAVIGGVIGRYIRPIEI